MMSEFEICQRYRQAKDKQRQIKILAELNAVYVSTIMGILKRNGELKKGGRQNGKATHV